MDSSELLKTVLASYEREYKELSETWRHIDDKAQANVTIVGIFLGATFIFVQASLVKDTTPLSLTMNKLLFLAIILLVGSAVFSIIALKVKKVIMGPTGQHLAELVNDLLQEAVPSSKRIDNFLRDQTQLWATANTDIQKKNTTKACLLFIGQILLIFSIVIFAVSIYLVLFN
jgi:hypothetical protein